MNGQVADLCPRIGINSACMLSHQDAIRRIVPPVQCAASDTSINLELLRTTACEILDEQSLTTRATPLLRHYAPQCSPPPTSGFRMARWWPSQLVLGWNDKLLYAAPVVIAR